MKPVKFQWKSQPVYLVNNITLGSLNSPNPIPINWQSQLLIPTNNLNAGAINKVAYNLSLFLVTSSGSALTAVIYGTDMYGKNVVESISLTENNSTDNTQNFYQSVNYIIVKGLIVGSNADIFRVMTRLSTSDTDAIGYTPPFICDVYRSNPQYVVSVEDYNAGVANSLNITPMVTMDAIPQWVNSGGNNTSQTPVYEDVCWQQVINAMSVVPLNTPGGMNVTPLANNGTVLIQYPISAITFQITSTNVNDSCDLVILAQGI